MDMSHTEMAGKTAAPAAVSTSSSCGLGLCLTQRWQVRQQLGHEIKEKKNPQITNQ